MDVTAWKSDTTSPTTRLTTRTGPASSAIRRSACDAMCSTVVSFTTPPPSWGRPRCSPGLRCPSRVERLEKGADDQGPAVDEHEQQDLEGKRNERGREHVHAHRHHDRRHHEVDDHEGDEDHEPH